MTVPQGPISPHLQIYKPQITSVLSITHRATGVVLSIGALMLSFWLMSIATGPETYSKVSGYINLPVGQAFLLLFTFSFYFHFCNGIRHLVWDMGLGLDLKTTYFTGYITIVASAVLTAATWVAGVML